MRQVVVLGASGFIGSAVCQVLEQQGHRPIGLRAPRLKATAKTDQAASAHQEIVDHLVAEISGADAVVNAAGNPDASEKDPALLIPANAILPGLVARAVRELDVGRFVHVSSAVVQGRKVRLDESEETQAFSAYSRSKAWGEHLVLCQAGGRAVIYRPPSVHAVDRRVTRAIGRVARSPLATVARPGTSPSPQALIGNVASAIAYLATTGDSPPHIVSHPTEGMTTEGLLHALGGRPPLQLPRWIARTGVGAFTLAGRLHPSLAANARRLEMLWLGQRQDPGWLTKSEWSAPDGYDAWRELGREIASPRHDHTQSATRRSRSRQADV